MTVVNGPEGNDSQDALRRGYIHTPPPLELPHLPSAQVSLWKSVETTRALRREGQRDGSLAVHVLKVRSDRRRAIHAERDRLQHEIETARLEDERARAHARERHLARYGL